MTNSFFLTKPVSTDSEAETLQIRVTGSSDQPALIYLPGLHGDWTLISSFRTALAGRACFVEYTYPRTLEWTLQDYARACRQALLDHGLNQGWLLAESYGSQIAWAMQGLPSADFRIQGIILAGGFVRHPAPWGVRGARLMLSRLPLNWMRAGLAVYGIYARFRHLHAPETKAALADFFARRTEPDRQAAAHRLRLIADNDPCAIAQQTRLPVYYLAGLVDPLVPWPWVRAWLGKHCPGYRGGRTFWAADHNVLATSPRPAAEQVLQWMKMEQTASGNLSIPHVKTRR